MTPLPEGAARGFRNEGMDIVASSKSGSGAQAPISTHPVFPAIVALWFAALFGIGSLVLPIALYENLVAATGIGSFFPAAQPPLGVTARIAIALGAALFGVLCGLYLARKVVESQAVQPVRQRSFGEANSASPHEPARRPISAMDELGAERLDAPVEDDRAAIPGRKRALAMGEEEGRSQWLENAPLPGQEFGPPLPGDEGDSEADTLELADFAEAVEAASEDETTDADVVEIEAPDSPEVKDDPVADETAPRMFDMPSPLASAAQESAAAPGKDLADMAPRFSENHEPAANDFAAQPPTPEAADTAASERQPEAASRVPLNERPLRELGVTELVERFALALQRREAAEAERQASDDAASPAPFAMPEPQQEKPADIPVSFAAPAHSGESPAPFAAPAEVSPEEAEAERVDFQAHARQSGTGPEVPSALRPIAAQVNFDDTGDEDEDDDDIGSFSLPLDPSARPFAAPSQPPAADPAQDLASDDETDDEDGATDYSSLLDMRRSIDQSRERVRIEDEAGDGSDDEEIEPVVVFPGQAERRAKPAPDGPSRDATAEPRRVRPFDAPAEDGSSKGAVPETPPARRPAPQETEKALREALEKLQRMSGAA